MAAGIRLNPKGSKKAGNRVACKKPALSYVKDGKSVIEVFPTSSKRVGRMNELDLANISYIITYA